MPSQVTDSNGVSWAVSSQLVTDIKSFKEYLTVDNGGPAFLVKYDDLTYSVYVQGGEVRAPEEPDDDSPEGVDAWMKMFFKKLVRKERYVRVFVGKSPDSGTRFDAYDGNSLLFEEPGGLYVCVSSTLKAFRPFERIDRFESPVIGADVSYPFAVGATTSYLIAEDCIVPNFEIPPDCDFPYDVAYMYHVEDDDSRHELSEKYKAARPIPGLRLILGRQ